MYLRKAITSNKGKVGRVLCVDVNGKNNNLTKPGEGAWQNANLSEPTKLQWIEGDSIKALYDAGYEPVGAGVPSTNNPSLSK